MKDFVQLFQKLDHTMSTLEKVAALRAYFSSASPGDSAWALYFLTGRKMKRFLSSKLLKEWALELTEVPEWLFEESYSSVGDLGETIALLVKASDIDGPPDKEGSSESPSLSDWIEKRLLPLRRLGPLQQKSLVSSWWRELDSSSVFILNKIISGSFRVGVSQGLVERALAEVANVPRPQIAHRLMGSWEANAAFFENLISKEADHEGNFSKPYPFYLASPLESGIAPDAIERELGAPPDWIAEWKWDGIRAQLVKRNQQSFLWSRGEELITERFPEISHLGDLFPDGTVLDGEILAYENGGPRPFGDLQKRIGKLKVTPSLLAEVPIVLIVYDLLEWKGQDLRTRPLSERREILARVLEGKSPRLILSSEVHAGSWKELARIREESCERKVEGLMLKRKNSTYQTGRKRGDWWKWKIDPYTIDAVLIYAQAGHGRRSSLFTDYTFALWDHPLELPPAKLLSAQPPPAKLVPVAKAYSGLTDVEIQELDRWIRAHTLEKFGPVRSVEPFFVFEIAFEGISRSTRHKSGVAVRFPRILRWRKDKNFQEADHLESLVKMIQTESAA